MPKPFHLDALAAQNQTYRPALGHKDPTQLHQCIGKGNSGCVNSFKSHNTSPNKYRQQGHCLNNALPTICIQAICYITLPLNSMIESGIILYQFQEY